MKSAFLFPGQGAQQPQMGCDFYRQSAVVRQLFELASDLYGRDLYQLLEQSDAATLKQTEVTQITITVVNLSAMQILQEYGVQAEACAGFSLGEYSALHCSGILSLNDTLRVVLARCGYMEQACQTLQQDGMAAGMVAVLGLELEEVAAAIAAYSKVYLANINSHNQLVIAGSQPDLAAAEAILRERGALRTVALAVSGPFHTPLMHEAESQLQEFLASVTFNEPKIPFYSGVSGELVTSGEQARQLAEIQIVSPVQWLKLLQSLSAAACQRLVESGPGRVLAGLWRSHDRKIKVLAAGTIAEIAAIAKTQKELT